MTEPRYTLHPQVNVSDLGFPDLPLYNFHIVIVVEPDPETWMITPGRQPHPPQHSCGQRDTP